MKINELMDKAVLFHGHSCPGLAIGVKAAAYILEHGNDFSKDEELVAVVENDNCSVDALQALLGTTFGKGNLIFRDYGKNNYTFFNRATEKAVKLKFKGNNPADRDLPREERIKKILSTGYEEIFDIKVAAYTPPDEAQIHESILCDNCGEPTMASRIINYKNQKLCIPCHRDISAIE